ncbi:MAG TPA: MurR/RpiR family transcriptional regulator [Clostridiales bacterium]|nr:MurR/RpiR family transcriptional regulator [Clostridiales bacterium]
MTNIEVKTRSIMKCLSKAEQKVANYFLNNIESIFSSPISKLAEESGVSQVTWIRFCKAIGFSGLKDLKKNLFIELNNTMPDKNECLLFCDIKKDSSFDDMCNTIKNTSIQAIEDTIKLIDSDKFYKAVNCILKSKFVRIFGVGCSGQVAKDLQRKLMRININTIFCEDLHSQLTYAANATADDVAIIFSYSGATKEMLEILSLTKEVNCTSIAITKFSKSPLASEADISIYLSAPDMDFWSGAMSSRIAQLVIIDLLFITLSNTNYTKIQKQLKRCSDVGRSHRI